MRRTPLLLALAALVLFAVACTPAAKPSLVGTWVSKDSSGKSANLSDLTLKADGTFEYAGKNALGGPVKFAGTYQTGTTTEGPWLRLTYSDFPDRSTLWFYRLEPTQLTVSAVAGDLANGSALVFTRR